MRVGTWWARFNDWRAPARLRVGSVAALATLACSLALLPVVARGFWLDRSIVVVAVVAAAGALMRTLRVPLPMLPIGGCLALLGALCALFVPGAAPGHVIVTPRAVAALRDLLRAGRADAWASVPPAEQTPGLLLIVVAAVGLVALIVDTLAAGLDLPGLALVPLAGLCAAPWVVGAGYPPATSLVLLLACWLTLLATHERSRVRTALPTAQPGPATPAVVAVAACMALALGVAAWLPAAGTGKRLAQSGPLGLGIDPIVSLRQAVIETSGRTVLTYRTTAQRPDYLRVAVLDRFDGQDWSASGAASEAIVQAASTGAIVGYELSIGPLAGSIVPSPAGTVSVRTDSPIAVSPAGLPMRTEGSVGNSNATLRVRQSDWKAQQLRRLSSQPAPAPAGTATDPTPVVGPDVAELAGRLTAGTANPFQAALALQDWFTTTGGFRYSTAIADEDADLASFLKLRVGYCEQFAATMAAMARTLGIPARVIVGFTPGTVRDGVWTVTDSDAHAWPELLMGAAGWVRFEPTPARRSISVPGYALADTEPSRPTISPEPSPATSSPSGALAPESPEARGAPAGAARSWWPTSCVVLVIILCLIPALLRWNRRRLRMSLGRLGPETAYREVVDTAIDLGRAGVGPSERSTLDALSAGLAVPARSAADRIAGAVERARYGPVGSAPTDGAANAPDDALKCDVDILRAAMKRQGTRRARWAGFVMPRSLWL